MKLHFEKRGQGPPLIFLHGLYGQGRNWRGIARQLEGQYTVYLPDLRNHGHSPWSEIWNLEVMAQDLLALMEYEHLESASLVGHSLGGKVAMVFATHLAPMRLRHLVVVDIAPRAYTSTYHHSLIQTLLSLDLKEIQTRQDADLRLKSAIPEGQVRQFLLSNLQRQSGTWAWQVNLPVIARHLAETMAELKRPQIPFQSCPVLFLQGSLSQYLQPEAQELIAEYFPQAQWVTIQAGHWIHAEAPQAFLQALTAFLGPS